VGAPFEKRATWEGDQRLKRSRPLRTYAPSTLEHLIEIVADARSLGRRVRAVGAGHSYSDAAQTSDFLVRTEALRGVFEIDECLREGIERGSRVRVRAGTTLIELQRALEARGRIFENTGTFNLLTIVGAAMTGTHGSGIARPSIVDQIEAVVVVTGLGEAICVQGAGGPLARSPVDGVPLREDDALFRALIPGLGATGLVESVVVRSVPFFWLSESRRIRDWRAVKSELALASGRALLHAQPGEEPRPWVEVYVNPYAHPSGERRAVVTRRTITAKRDARGARARRPLGYTLFDRYDPIGNVAAWIFEHSPEEWPQHIDAAFAQMEDTEFTARGYDVLSDGTATDGVGLELALELDDQDRWLDAVDALFAHLGADARDGMQYSNMVAMRFVAPSDRTLSPHCWDSGRGTCMLELPILTRIHGVFEIYERAQRAMVGHGARPHWGLEHGSLCAREVRALYGEDRLAVWRAQRDSIDPHRLFASRFTDRLGLT
jgi:FAD/FMN-containing dehydrogenase